MLIELYAYTICVYIIIERLINQLHGHLYREKLTEEKFNCIESFNKQF